MIPITRLLVEPFYRHFFGEPVADGLPVWPVPGLSGTALRNTEALVLVADGVGGLDLCGTALRYVLAAAGLKNHAVHVFPWGHGFGRWWADLSNIANRDLKAALMAEAVQEFRRRLPDAPVFLVGKSGGSGVVVKALELLEEGAVERAVLLAPALSPGYDLTAALRGPARAGGLLVAAGRIHPRRRDARLRHGRSGADRQRGAGRLSRTRDRAGRRLCDAAAGALVATHGGERLPGGSPGAGFTGFPQEIRCAPVADRSSERAVKCSRRSSRSDAGPIS